MGPVRVTPAPSSQITQPAPLDPRRARRPRKSPIHTNNAGRVTPQPLYSFRDRAATPSEPLGKRAAKYCNYSLAIGGSTARHRASLHGQQMTGPRRRSARQLAGRNDLIRPAGRPQRVINLRQADAAARRWPAERSGSSAWQRRHDRPARHKAIGRRR